jgi:hypothetical protein
MHVRGVVDCMCEIDMRTPVIPPERREGMHVGLFVFSCAQPLFPNFPFAFSEVYLDFGGGESCGVVWCGKGKKKIAIDRLATGVPWCRAAVWQARTQT